jgi:hypothetical protein
VSAWTELVALKQEDGLGTLIAWIYVLTIEDPHRFRSSRTWVAFSGCGRAGGILAIGNPSYKALPSLPHL